MIVSPLSPERMAGFIPDPRMKLSPGGDYWARMAEDGYAYAIARDDGRVVGACGYWLYEPSNPRLAEMWALFSQEAGPLMLAVTRRTLATLEVARDAFDRIRAFVEPAFPPAVKWVLLLGFQPTGARIATPIGDLDEYVWAGAEP